MSVTIAAYSDGHQRTCVDRAQQFLGKMRKRDRLQNFPDKEEVGLMHTLSKAGLACQDKGRQRNNHT